jgi:hypothetical protein
MIRAVFVFTPVHRVNHEFHCGRILDHCGQNSIFMAR